MSAVLRTVALIVFGGAITACATLLPKTDTVPRSTAYDDCVKGVIQDAVITSGNVVAIGISNDIPVEVAAEVLRQVAEKETAALKTCAEGKTPEKLWQPSDNAENEPKPPTVESDNTNPTQRF